jgi:phosphate transport system permease protein
LFAYALFALFLGPGIRLGVIGSVALAVLMIPIVIRSAEEILKIVPNHLREAAYALGTPKWKVVLRIVLPTALAGLVTGVMLAVARVIGETAPLLVTTGVIDSVNTDPTSGRMQNLAVYAYSEYKDPGVQVQASYDKAWAAVLTLIVLVMLLSLIARWIYRRFGTDLR